MAPSNPAEVPMPEINEHWRSQHLSAEEHPGARRAAIRDLIVEHVDSENAKDMERCLKTYSEDCVFDDVPTRTLFNGKKAIADSYIERFVAYPNLERIITRMTVDDHSCVVEITMRGVQEKTYRGFPATKRVQELQLVGHFVVSEDLLITRETAYYDQLKAAVELGALPDITKPAGRVWLAFARPQVLIKQIWARFAG